MLLTSWFVWEFDHSGPTGIAILAPFFSLTSCDGHQHLSSYRPAVWSGNNKLRNKLSRVRLLQ